ncbi:MAG: ComF family protein [bacterium]|nr:ComF family protein [bacterium]
MFKFLLEAIFPSFCYVCGKPSKGILCEDCRKRFEKKRIDKIFFPDSDHLSRIYIVFEYRDEVQKLIEEFKYGKRKEVARYFSPYLSGFSLSYDFIVPVPLHPVRFRERGFNQSELIAERLSKEYSIPLMKRGIKRIKYTVQQANLTRNERLQNLSGAFYVKHPERFEGKKILLIDDVYTTGATIENLAKAFRNFPSRVDGFVIASKV